VAVIDIGTTSIRMEIAEINHQGEVRTLEKLSQAGLPNLWMPRPNQFFLVEELPLLGTGKLDLRRIREIALDLSSVRSE